MNSRDRKQQHWFKLGAVVVAVLFFGLAYHYQRALHDGTGLVFGVLGLLLLAYVSQDSK